MPFQYKKVLVIGATSGIGWALAEKFVENGTSVIVAGRRKERLDAFVKQYGGSGDATVDSVVFDVTDLKSIPEFATEQFDKHPDIDCVWLNSGIQRRIDWAKPEDVSLETIEQENVSNFLAVIHMTKAFLPHLRKQAPKDTAIIYTTSGLALIPSAHAINYSAAKAAVHHTLLPLREQLRQAKSNVKIIELLPPAVQTELHDFEMGKEKGQALGMPLKDFTEEAFEGLCRQDNEQIPIGMAKTAFNSWEQERQKTFLKMHRG